MQPIIAFDIGDVSYGISSDYILEIMKDRTCTPFPCAPFGVLGATYYESKCRLILDVSTYLQKEPVITQKCYVLISVQQTQFFLCIPSIPYLFQEGEDITDQISLHHTPLRFQQILIHENKTVLVISMDDLLLKLKDAFHHNTYPW